VVRERVGLPDASEYFARSRRDAEPARVSSRCRCSPPGVPRTSTWADLAPASPRDRSSNPDSICGLDEGDYVHQSLNSDFSARFRVPALPVCRNVNQECCGPKRLYCPVIVESTDHFILHREIYGLRK
jgi:hypothetical protein